MSHNKYSAKEVVERGEAIYRDRIAGKFSAADRGKFVVIDIETGDYEVADDDLAATKRALAKRPDAVLYGLRIGYPAAYRLGIRDAGSWNSIPTSVA